MTITREAVLQKAQSWVGMTERTGRNDIWFADDWGITGYSWCYAFVQSCFYYAGEQLPYVTMWVPGGVAWSRDNGQSVEDLYSPIPGDIVHFTWGDGYGRYTPGTGDHVGIVTGIDGDTLYTIEGNTGPGDGVWNKARSISGTVINYWRPSTYGNVSLGTPITEPVPTPVQPTPNYPPWPGVYLRNYTSGNGTSTWQQRMRDRGWNIDVDDEYGPQSEQICTQFQSEKGLEVDGVVGPMTWGAAWTAPVT